MKFFFLFVFCLLGCSHMQSGKENLVSFKNSKKTYQFTDVSGVYDLERTVQLKNKNKVIIKTEIYASMPQRRLVEKTISISDLGFVKTKKGKRPMLRPEVSQHSVWLNGKEYFVQAKLNTKEKALDLLLKSPEEQWNGNKKQVFPSGAYTYCYYSQLVECLRVVGVLSQFAKEQKGEYAFKIIWDGYPYFQEQYLNIPAGSFADAVVRFEESPEKDVLAYQIEVAGQVLVYHLDSQFQLEQIFWVAQGVTLSKPGKDVSLE